MESLIVGLYTCKFFVYVSEVLVFSKILLWIIGGIAPSQSLGRARARAVPLRACAYTHT